MKRLYQNVRIDPRIILFLVENTLRGEKSKTLFLRVVISFLFSLYSLSFFLGRFADGPRPQGGGVAAAVAAAVAQAVAQAVREKVSELTSLLDTQRQENHRLHHTYFPPSPRPPLLAC